jgi:hypothetical protein
MTGLRVRLCLAFLAVCLLVTVPARPASACPFCGMQGQTLTQEVDQAALVLYGKMKNARLANPGLEGGVTDLVLDPAHGVIKPHPWVADKKVVAIPRYIPTGKEEGVPFLVFCDVFRGKLDPYRGLPVKAGDEVPRYLKGAVSVKEKKTPEKLKFFFDWLQNEDLEIANDALKEYGNSSYEDFRQMVHAIPADKVAEWLQDRNTPGYRVGLYASMLGHASKKPAEHAKLLRTLIDDPEKQVSSGVDGILAGQVLLQPREGLEYLRGLLSNPKREFPLRYAALKAVRFFHDSRPDVIDPKDTVLAAALLLEQKDICDLAIEDLRKWKCWDDYTTYILKLKDRPTHDLPIVRRAVLRFMLCSPLPEAKAYVAEVRKVDEDLVTTAEELLKSEQTATPETRSPGSN